MKNLVSRYNGASKEERIEKGKNGHEFASVGGTKESVEWLWSTFPPFLTPALHVHLQ
jgi:hypothetical protein